MTIFKPIASARRTFFAVMTVFQVCVSANTWAGEVSVAVASNFKNPLRHLAQVFTEQTSHVVNISSGSTGKLYAQINNGAPFDVFLAANVTEPVRLEKAGLAIAESRFTYAIGKLALWSADSQRIKDACEVVLRKKNFSRLAIANPRIAPYGAQAVMALKSLHVYDDLEPRLVLGANISQAFQFVFTQSTELGIVSLSQIVDPNTINKGSHCLIDNSLYDPLLQQGQLLLRAKNSGSADDFLSFLRSDEAQALIVSYGYGLP